MTTDHMPETDSDQRMHVLADDCWCHPDIATGRPRTRTHHTTTKTEEPRAQERLR